MKKLLKAYNLTSDMQYFELIAESFFNGNIGQAVDQFKSMPKKYRINFLRFATVEQWESGISRKNMNRLFDVL